MKGNTSPILDVPSESRVISDEEKLRWYIEQVAKYNGENYSMNSEEGNELQEILYYIMLDINTKKLSPEMKAKKKVLEELLVNSKIRGIV